jgi:chaperonin GroEL
MKIISKRDAMDVFSEASEILNTACEHTLGPDGTNTAVHFQNFYNIINDGKSIIEQLTSLEPEIAPAIETLKQASFETNKKAGDGTTSTIVIMNQLIQGARAYLKNNRNTNRVELATNLKIINKKLQELIEKDKIKIDNTFYKKIANVSLGSSEYSDIMSEAFNYLDKIGTPTLVKSEKLNVSLEKIDGINLNKISFASSMFVDILPEKEMNNVEAYLLFQPINRFEELTPFIKKLNQTKNYKILFYNELGEITLENLLYSLSQNYSKIIPVCIKNYGKDMGDLFNDLANYTGTKIIDGGALKISDIDSINAGKIDKAVISLTSVTIKNDTVENNDYNYQVVPKKACIIYAGGANKIEIEDNYKRLEDALYSIRGAIQYGVFQGGYGKAYSDLISELEQTIDIPQFVLDAMKYIKNIIFYNKQANNDAYDSALVISEVINNAFSMAAQVLTTTAIIYDNIR